MRSLAAKRILPQEAKSATNPFMIYRGKSRMQGEGAIVGSRTMWLTGGSFVDFFFALSALVVRSHVTQLGYVVGI